MEFSKNEARILSRASNGSKVIYLIIPSLICLYFFVLSFWQFVLKAYPNEEDHIYVPVVCFLLLWAIYNNWNQMKLIKKLNPDTLDSQSTKGDHL